MCPQLEKERLPVRRRLAATLLNRRAHLKKIAAGTSLRYVVTKLNKCMTFQHFIFEYQNCWDHNTGWPFT